MGGRRLVRLFRQARRQGWLVIAAVCVAIIIALVAVRPVRGSLLLLPSVYPSNLATRLSSPSMAGLSLPERLSAVYKDYMEEMHATQAQAEAGGAWTMPEECKRMVEEMDSKKSFYSELGQDLFLYKHFFPNGRTSDGRKRFFLDIGANSPRDNSNTLFFEKCLGWEGVCVEANPDLAKKFVGQRKCKIENVCISDKASTLKFLKAGYMGHVVVGQDNGATNGVQDDGETVEIPCLTITELLAKHNVTHVDMLSIDIEAAEYNALSPLLVPEARDIKIDVMTVEVFWSDAQLRWLLSDLGFWKVTDIAHVDDIFVRVKFMDHAMADARPSYYQMMQASQRERGRPIIAPW